MAGWRDRIDPTANWAITVVAAMLSVSLSTPTAQHGVLLFAMVLVLFLLVIEARRYRFFDVCRNRVRQMERNYFTQIFSPNDGTTDYWIHTLGDDLRRSLFLTSHSQAISRRMRRNYCWLFLILLMAWLVKTTFIRMQESATEAHIVGSVGEWVRNAAVRPVPG